MICPFFTAQGLFCWCARSDSARKYQGRAQQVGNKFPGAGARSYHSCHWFSPRVISEHSQQGCRECLCLAFLEIFSFSVLVRNFSASRCIHSYHIASRLGVGTGQFGGDEPRLVSTGCEAGAERTLPFGDFPDPMSGSRGHRT